jgi:hypothetical protein
MSAWAQRELTEISVPVAWDYAKLLAAVAEGLMLWVWPRGRRGAAVPTDAAR